MFETSIVNKQREYFNSGATKEISFRRKQLVTLLELLKRNESNLLTALNKDLGKSNFESYETELSLIYEEINFMLKNLKKLTVPRRVKVSLAQFPAKSKIYKEPLGVVLVVSPWNYPLLLSIMPMVGAIAAGNCVVLKPSNYSSNVSMILEEILAVFDERFIKVIRGGRDVNQSLFETKFDHIFFTGSVEVGKIVMEKAAKNLTPVTLELGGKSPCIVDLTANIDISAKRIVWGKLVNCGQTCVAPDYVFAHKDIKDQLVLEMKKWIVKFYGENQLDSPDYPKIINKKHFDRLNKLISNGTVEFGGKSRVETNKISPAILTNVQWDDEIMQEEIFGPILPIIEYTDINEVIIRINSRPKPLALYLFTKSKQIEKCIIRNISYGGGCVNDTLLHLASSTMAFGGVGDSGMGSYHGAKSIDTFSHSKSVMKKFWSFDIPIRYAPYKDHLKLLRKLLK